MYKWWITFFLLGSLLSKYNDNIYLHTSTYSSYILFSYIVFILIFLFIDKFYKKKIFSILKTLTILSSFLWGTSHSAPGINHSIKNIKISKASLGFGTLIVKDIDTNHIYETIGTYKGNKSGSIRCFKTGSFFSKNCMFINSERYDVSVDNLLLNLSYIFKNFLYKNIQSREYLKKFKGFILGIILGDKNGISYHNKEVFKKLGIYHLLIISGLHFSLFAFFIREFIFFIIKIFYIFKIISPLSWIKISIIFDIIICVVLILFSYIVGLSSATQRALLIFIVHRLSSYTTGILPRSHLIPLTITLQTLLFPLGFISVATLISWISYILFIDLSYIISRYKYEINKNFCTNIASYFSILSYSSYLLEVFKEKFKLFIFKIFNIFYIQIKLMFLIFIGFSQLSLISCIVNLIVVPIFPIILFISLYFCLTEPNILDSYFYNVFILFFNLIYSFLELENKISAYIDIEKLSTLKSFKILSLILSTIWLWNLYKKIFIPNKLFLNIHSHSNEE